MRVWGCLSGSHTGRTRAVVHSAMSACDNKCSGLSVSNGLREHGADGVAAGYAREGSGYAPRGSGGMVLESKCT